MEYFKICKRHGGLSEEQVYKTKKRGKPYFGCRLCVALSRAKTALKVFKDKECEHHGKLTPDLVDTQGKCRLCGRFRMGKYKKENRPLINARIAKDKEKNPEKWKNIFKAVYQQQKEKYGALHSLKKCCDERGITIEQYNEMHDQQKGVCAICFQPETRINGRRTDKTKPFLRLTIDHCHKTNKVRGLLCHNCNTGIGKFFDNVPRIIRATRYIKEGGFRDENNNS